MYVGDLTEMLATKYEEFDQEPIQDAVADSSDSPGDIWEWLAKAYLNDGMRDSIRATNEHAMSLRPMHADEAAGAETRDFSSLSHSERLVNDIVRARNLNYVITHNLCVQLELHDRRR